MKGKFFILIAALLGLLNLGIGHGEEPYIATEYSLLEPYMKVMAADSEYLWAAGGIGEEIHMKILYKSKDYGESWDKAYTFNKVIEGIHITKDETMFISISHNRWLKDAGGEIWRSIDRGATFHKALELKSGGAYHWNMTSDEEGVIFVSEYGYKDEEENARRIYRSMDNGANWKEVYTPDEMWGYHNHVIAVDKDDNNIIYQSIGDKVRKIIRSEDRGTTWNEIIDGYNPTSMLQIDNIILWGLDNPQEGIIRYNKDTGELDYSFTPPEPFKGSIYDLLYVNDVIYAGLLTYDHHDWDGSIFISKDKGATWQNFAIWPKTEDIGIGFYKFTTLGDYGFAWVSLPIEKDGQIEKYQGTLRFELLNPTPHR